MYYETYNPSYGRGPRFARRGRFGTSSTELFHLGVAVAVLTTAIVLWMFTLGSGGLGDLGLVEKISVAFGIAITGFALHELGHKVTAQHFGHWSEFRYSLPGLALTLLFSAFGVLVGAPGATWHTATSERDNGKISAAGPLVNILIALGAFPLTLGMGPDIGLLNLVAEGVLLFNTILAGFNLLPIGALDGRKVVRWSPVVYGVLVGLVVLLVVYADPFGLLF